MMKLAGLVAALVFAGCAGQAPKTAPDNDAPKLASYQDRYCLRETGTNLHLRPGRCVPASGWVYTREDLDRTGGFTIGESLRRLLPY